MVARGRKISFLRQVSSGGVAFVQLTISTRFGRLPAVLSALKRKVFVVHSTADSSSERINLSYLSSYSSRGLRPAVSYPSDEVWVERIRSGDEEAFEALFHAFYDRLVEFVRLYAVVTSMAEDLVQNIFLDIWRRREDWYPRGALKAYLYGAARNKALEHLRNRRTARHYSYLLKEEQFVSRDGPEADLRFTELEHAVRRAIEELPERRRLVFKLSRQHDLTYAEIATLLGISVNTVENQMVHAIRFLRRRLSAYSTLRL